VIWPEKDGSERPIRSDTLDKPFKDNWVFDITVRNGKLTKIREYIDTQALARASQMDASKRA